MSSKIASVCLLVVVAISSTSATIPIPSLTLTGIPQLGIGLPTAAAGATAAALPTLAVELPTLPAFAGITGLTASATLPALPSLAIPGVTAATGGTAFVASGGNVAIAAAAIAGLAIAKEALILATIHDHNKKNKSKREAVEDVDFSKMFERIAKQDVADCGKLLVCQSFAKSDGKRTGEEKAVVNLFNDLSTIQNNAYGTYQWAAYSGSFQNPIICIERYGKCPVSQSILANLVAPQ